MSRIGRNIWFASLSFLLPSIFTYGFWFLTAKLVGSDAIGIASTIGAITIIFATIDVLDVSLGMKRSLGIAFASGDLLRFKQILTSAIIFVSFLTCFTIILLALPQFHILESIGIDRAYIWIIIAMIPALSFQHVFSEAIISALESKHLLLPLIVGSILRIPILLILVYILNQPIEGPVIAYSSLIFVPTIFYAHFLKNLLPTKPRFNFCKIISDIKGILSASLASWFPHMLSVLGSQLGVVTVFSFGGSSEGGLFYIPMAIFSVVLFLITAMNKVSHPLIAGISSSNDQINLLTQLMKVAFAFTMPLVTPLLYFSADFLGLLGTEFRQAATTMSIMIAGIPFAIITEMVYYFVYGRGDNKTVLYLGLFGNCPRIILYILLTPELGAVGAAVAYLAGTISQMLFTARVARSHSLNLRYSACLLMSIVPLSLGLLAWIFQLNYMLSVIVIFLISLTVYIKLHMLHEADIINIVHSSLPDNYAKKLNPLIIFIVRKLA